MDGIQLEQKIRDTEDRVRALLARTSSDDSFACQTELRDTMDELRRLRAQRYGADDAAHAP